MLGFRNSREANSDETRIRVADGAFHPAEIHAIAGRPTLVTFHREDPSACVERVVFPSLALDQELALGRDVTVELTPQAPGESEFSCGMGMLHGRLIVTESEETATAGCHQHAGHEHPAGESTGHAHSSGCCDGHGSAHGHAEAQGARPMTPGGPNTGAARGHQHA